MSIHILIYEDTNTNLHMMVMTHQVEFTAQIVSETYVRNPRLRAPLREVCMPRLRCEEAQRGNGAAIKHSKLNTHRPHYRERVRCK